MDVVGDRLGGQYCGLVFSDPDTGCRYWLDPDDSGARAENRKVQLDEDRLCYFDENGCMAFGECLEHGGWYYYDEKTGAQIVLKALEAPLFHIAANAGLEGSVIINKVKESKVGIGFDAYKEEYVDMKKAGIVDPTKVSRSALQNAASVAAMILTTESIVTDKKEEKACNCGGHETPDMSGMY